MANLCYQSFTIRANNEKELNRVIYELLDEEGKKLAKEGKEPLKDIIESNFISRESFDIYCVIYGNKEDMLLTYNTKWEPRIDHFMTEFFKNSDIYIEGYEEEAGDGIFETYKKTGKGFPLDITVYGDSIEEKLEFYSISDGDENSIIGLVYPYGTYLEDPYEYIDLTDNEGFTKEVDNIVKGNYTDLSLFVLLNDCSNIEYIKSIDDVKTIFEKSKSSTIEDIVKMEPYLLLNVMYSIRNHLNKEVECIIDFYKNELINGNIVYIRGINKFLGMVENPLIIFNELYDAMEDPMILLKEVEDRYLNKRQLMEKRLI